MKPFLTIVAVGLLLSSCNLNKVKQVGNESWEVLQRNCNCADTQVDTESSNGQLRMEINLTGCDTDNYEEEGLRLSKILIDSVENICDMTWVQLNFIDKGIQHSTDFHKCELPL